MCVVSEVVDRLIELKNERDAFRKAKLGITEVQRNLQEELRTTLPDPALQKLIDFADRRINATTFEILRIEGLNRKVRG